MEYMDENMYGVEQDDRTCDGQTEYDCSVGRISTNLTKKSFKSECVIEIKPLDLKERKTKMNDGIYANTSFTFLLLLSTAFDTKIKALE